MGPRLQSWVLTVKTFQGVIATLLLAGEEAIAVQEVGPVHLDGLEGVDAARSHRRAGGAARPQHRLLFTARHQHRAAQHADLRVAPPAEQSLDHAQEEILRPLLGLLPGPVAGEVGEHGLGVGHVAAVGQHHICAFR